LPPEQFIGLLKKTACLIGNSSAGIKECSFLGVPVVNIGTRQNGRYRGKHIIDVPHARKYIHRAIKQQIGVGRYKSDRYFYLPNSSKNIARILSTVPLYRQKRFHEKISRLPALT
jgi:UDP-N-acetylglucosamine 2-epimerase